MGRVDRAAKLFYSKPLNFISVVKLVYGDEVVEQEAEDMREGLFSYVESVLGYESDRNAFKGVLERNRDMVKKNGHIQRTYRTYALLRRILF